MLDIRAFFHIKIIKLLAVVLCLVSYTTVISLFWQKYYSITINEALTPSQVQPIFFKHREIGDFHYPKEIKIQVKNVIECLDLPQQEGRPYYYPGFKDVQSYPDERLKKGLLEIEERKSEYLTAGDNKDNYKAQYVDMCRDETNYYVIFKYIQVPRQEKTGIHIFQKAFAAGGVSQTNFLAIIDKKYNTTIYPDIEMNIKPIGIGDKNNHFGPYFTCPKMSFSTFENVYLICGSGDGPGWSSNLVRMNMIDKDFIEVAVCSNYFNEDKTNKKQSGTAESLYGNWQCYDREGREYYTVEEKE